MLHPHVLLPESWSLSLSTRVSLKPLSTLDLMETSFRQEVVNKLNIPVEPLSTKLQINAINGLLFTSVLIKLYQLK